MSSLSDKIIDKEFQKGLRGYNPNEVDDFLDDIAADVEVLSRENVMLKERIASMEKTLNASSDIGLTIQNTLIMAQSAAETAKAQAEKEAELILREAHEKSRKIVEDSYKTHERILKETDKAKADFTIFNSRVLSFMENITHAFKEGAVSIEGSYDVSAEDEKVNSNEGIIYPDEEVMG